MKIDDAATELLEKNKLILDTSTFRIKEFIRHSNKDNYYYECNLSKDGSDLIYMSSKDVTTKKQALYSALEHIAKMGYNLEL